ncbi:MAG: hypothetical protein AB7I09_15435, partial [Planctomycetota bacterium]
MPTAKRTVSPETLVLGSQRKAFVRVARETAGFECGLHDESLLEPDGFRNNAKESPKNNFDILPSIWVRFGRSGKLGTGGVALVPVRISRFSDR